MKPDIGPFVTDGEVTASDMNAIVNAFDAITVESLSDDYTLQASDAGKLLLMTAGINITVPSGLPIGFNCKFVQTVDSVQVIFVTGDGMINMSRLNKDRTHGTSGDYTELFVIDSENFFLLTSDLTSAI